MCQICTKKKFFTKGHFYTRVKKNHYTNILKKKNYQGLGVTVIVKIKNILKINNEKDIKTKTKKKSSIAKMTIRTK